MSKHLKYVLAALAAMVLTIPVAGRDKSSRGLVDSHKVEMSGSSDSSATEKRRKKKFINPTVVYRNEIMGGTGLLYTNFNSNNSEFMLLANNISASGNIFRFSPFVTYAYKDNAAIGIRANITTANAKLDKATASLLSEDLSLSVSDLTARLTSYGATIYHRNYFGLEKSGTVGLFIECALKYAHNKLDMGSNNYNTVEQLRLGMAPGIILYVLPFASVEASIGIVDLTGTMSTSYKNGESQGTFKKIKANANLNILNCNFGITFHF